jgi:hypothetical protein
MTQIYRSAILRNYKHEKSIGLLHSKSCLDLARGQYFGQSGSVDSDLHDEVFVLRMSPTRYLPRQYSVVYA